LLNILYLVIYNSTNKKKLKQIWSLLALQFCSLHNVKISFSSMKEAILLRAGGNVSVGEIFKFVKSFKGMLGPFSHLALPAMEYQ